MSVRVSAWVWAQAPVKSGELVVLLAVADNAHDDGGGAYPSQEHLAEKARMSVRQVRRCLASLEAKDQIEKQGVTRKGITVWRVVMGDHPDKMSAPDADGQEADTHDRDPGHGRPTEPSENRQEPSSGEDEPLIADAVDDVRKRAAEVARQKSCAPPSRAAVAAVMASFPDVDYASLLTEFEYWHLHGKGARRKPQSLAGSLREFAKRAAADLSVRPVQSGVVDDTRDWDAGLST